MTKARAFLLKVFVLLLTGCASTGNKPTANLEMARTTSIQNCSGVGPQLNPDCVAFWDDFNTQLYSFNRADPEYTAARTSWNKLKPIAQNALLNVVGAGTFATEIRMRPDAAVMLAAVNKVTAKQIEHVKSRFNLVADEIRIRDCFALFARHELCSRQMDASQGWVEWLTFLYAATELDVPATKTAEWYIFSRAVIEGYLNESYIGKRVRQCQCPNTTILGNTPNAVEIRSYINGLTDANAFKQVLSRLGKDIVSSRCLESRC